ncbi:IS5/IS1182 family transposase, partial [Pseudomonas syringae pv. actinidiae]
LAKENRRIGTRYDKLAKSYAAMVTLACAYVVCGQYFSYKT